MHRSFRRMCCQSIFKAFYPKRFCQRLARELYYCFDVTVTSMPHWRVMFYRAAKRVGVIASGSLTSLLAHGVEKTQMLEKTARENYFFLNLNELRKVVCVPCTKQEKRFYHCLFA